MIPMHARVAVIDDVEDHLQKVSWGLAKAGLSAIPFFFDDGELENPPPEPIQGIRVVFTDIHLVGGGPGNAKLHAANIIRCLRSIVAPGPYVLVFWSQFPEDGNPIKALIEKDGPGVGLTLPIGYGSIDKNLIFNVSPPAGTSEDFKINNLIEKIIACLMPFNTLAVAMSWEDRATRAAAKTTDRLFSLTEKCEPRLASWERLLAFLACETVGKEQAVNNLQAALDAALLPLLEDQLGSITTLLPGENDNLVPLQSIVAAEGRVKCPRSISLAALNASYLIDESGLDRHPRMWDRGMVTELGGAFVNSGDFVRAFGREKSDLLQKEFQYVSISQDDSTKLKLHIVALDAECDHVQNKIATRRYLLALMVPSSLIYCCQNGDRFKNESIIDIGCFSLPSAADEPVHLLVSSRCFMALAPGKVVDGKCRFRIRRLPLEDLMHRYTSYVRRPGVLRFKS